MLRTLCILMLMGGSLSFVGCSQNPMIKSIMPAGADARARAYLSLLARGEVDPAAARLLPELQTENGRRQLEGMAALLRGRIIDSLQVIGVQVRTLASTRHVNVDYELGDARGWVVANVAVRERGAEWSVEGVNAQGTAGPLSELNRFRLAGQTPVRYLWLLLMLVAGGASAAAAAVIAWTRGMPRRWWWVIVALFGMGQFALNWTTGQLDFSLFQFQLLSAGVVKTGPVAPWILTFSLPMGAVVALSRRRRWRAGLQGQPTSEGAGSPNEAAG
jgi:hypothetical protein